MDEMTRYRGGRDLLSQIHNDFNRLLAPFELRMGSEWPKVAMSEWAPSIDVKETNDQYVIHADVPGVKADHIDVSMENGRLTIKGKRESEVKKEQGNYLRIERSSGSFLRQLTLPETVDQGNIKARCHDGVLEVILPKAAQSAGRKIKVKQD